MLRAKEVLRGGAADRVGGEPDLPPGRVADEEGRDDGDGHDGDDLGWVAMVVAVVFGGRRLGEEKVREVERERERGREKR